MTNLTLRNVKGTALTYNEGDANFANLDSDSPWVVAAGRIYYPGNVGIGPNSSNPTYHLDFGEGDSATNEATIGTRDADLHVHVDGARKFKVTTNSQERLTLTTTGKFGIGQPNPQFELDVDGYANISNTLYGNAVEANSFTDGTLSISGGSILQAKRIVSTTQIDFTQLYDRSTGYRVSRIDSELTSSPTAFPTSSAVKFVTDNLGDALDSEHAWAVSKFDSEHAWNVANDYRQDSNIDSVFNALRAFQRAQDSDAAATGLQEITDVGNVTTTTVRLSGGVETTTLTGSHLGFAGLEFAAEVLPLDNNGDQTSGVTDLGSSSVKWKDGYFSGTVNATGIYREGMTGLIFGSGTNPSSVLPGTGQTTNNGQFDLGSSTSKFKDAYFSGLVTAGIVDARYGSNASVEPHKFLVEYASGTIGAFIGGDPTTATTIIKGHAGGGQSAANMEFRLRNGSAGDITALTLHKSTGDATFSGTVNASSLTATNVYRTLANACGIQFDVTAVVPTNNAGTRQNDLVDFGSTTYKWKNAHFSGKVTGGSFAKSGGTSSQFLMADGSTTVASGIAAGSLSPGKNINGTLFNGTANITTANWGTARNISIGGTSKSVNGSANYTWTKAEIQANNADTLTTARNINGTAFNGTANITTANWGTARNISIGGTAKSVNGSTNYTWTTAEIGITKANIDALGINASSLSNTFTVQGVAYNGSQAKTVSFTAGNGLTLTGTQYTMSGSYTGTFTATGDVVAYSDVAFKEEINPIVGALEKVSEIGGYTFKRKDDDSRKYTGVIAQEIQKVLPEAVHSGEQGLSVAYGNLTGLLIEAVKELNAKVKDLESKLGV